MNLINIKFLAKASNIYNTLSCVIVHLIYDKICCLLSLRLQVLQVFYVSEPPEKFSQIGSGVLKLSNSFLI
jgi:hypothetical protein